MNRRTVFVAVAFFCIPTALLGQYAGRHGGSNSGKNQGESTAPADNSDLTDFKRAVAEEATDTQVTQFKVLAYSTKDARQEMQTLRKSRPEDVIKQASVAQNAVDEVQREERDFLRTFSDAQVTALKKQTKKLTQSDAAVMKEAKKLATELDRTPPDLQRLEGAAAGLEQALATLQSDQDALGKEMGVGTH